MIKKLKSSRNNAGLFHSGDMFAVPRYVHSHDTGPHVAPSDLLPIPLEYELSAHAGVLRTGDILVILNDDAYQVDFSDLVRWIADQVAGKDLDRMADIEPDPDDHHPIPSTRYPPLSDWSHEEDPLWDNPDPEQEKDSPPVMTRPLGKQTQWAMDKLYEWGGIAYPWGAGYWFPIDPDLRSLRKEDFHRDFPEALSEFSIPDELGPFRSREAGWWRGKNWVYTGTLNKMEKIGLVRMEGDGVRQWVRLLYHVDRHLNFTKLVRWSEEPLTEDAHAPFDEDVADSREVGRASTLLDLPFERGETPHQSGASILAQLRRRKIVDTKG